MQTNRIQIDSTSKPAQLNRPWKKLITAGRAFELMRTDLRRQLDRGQREIGWEYCRFHALFHDDMAVVKQDKNGQTRYQWRTIEEIYDTLLDVGLRPFAELNPMPSALASGSQTMFWYGMNVTPPKDYNQWEDLIENYARHCIRRYGRTEVRKWYFELWNEPNMPAFWTGGFDGYVKLYEHTVKALRRVDKQLRLGGPATAGAGWVPEFTEACAKRGLPLDFVSTHRYPQDAFTPIAGNLPAGLDTDTFFDDSFRQIQNAVKASAYPDAEIHWTECNCMNTTGPDRVSWTQNPNVESSYAASFIARHCTGLDDTCDSMGWWALSDIFEESGQELHPFYCGYGLLNVNGLAKASYNAFRFLEQLGTRRKTVTFDQPLPKDCGAVATEDEEVVRILMWNHPSLNDPSPQDWNVAVSAPGPAGIASFQHILPGAGSPVETWNEMGCPHHLHPHTEKILDNASRPQTWLARPDVQGDFPIKLPPFSTALFEWSPAAPRMIGRGAAAYDTSHVAEDRNLESQLSGYGD